MFSEGESFEKTDYDDTLARHRYNFLRESAVPFFQFCYFDVECKDINGEPVNFYSENYDNFIAQYYGYDHITKEKSSIFTYNYSEYDPLAVDNFYRNIVDLEHSLINHIESMTRTGDRNILQSMQGNMRILIDNIFAMDGEGNPYNKAWKLDDPDHNPTWRVHVPNIPWYGLTKNENMDLYCRLVYRDKSDGYYYVSDYFLIDEINVPYEEYDNKFSLLRNERDTNQINCTIAFVYNS